MGKQKDLLPYLPTYITPMNVLVIDDDADDTELFCEALNELFPEVNCRSVNSCERINETLHDISPDIIFMDGHMYPIGGKECLKLLHECIDRKRIKIIIHSASLSPAELNEFKQAGVDDILFKVGDYNALKAGIASMIHKYSSVSS